MSKVRFIAIVLVLVMMTMVANAQESGSKLKEIQDRGVLKCGVGNLTGFSAQNPSTSEWEGLDADFCRAVAVAIFGRDYTSHLEFVPLTSDARFVALQAGEVDVLIRNTTATFTRDAKLGSDFGPTTFYDGQGILVRIDDGFTSLADMQGASFCTTSGTTTEKNISEAYMGLFGETISLVYGADAPANLADFEAGSCDAITSDKSQLSSIRSTSSDPSALTILADTLSKEPLGPMYLSGDPMFADIVDWAVYATFQAEEYGISSANVEEMMMSEDINIQRFLGLTEDELGSSLGISNSFAGDIVAVVGNYAEIYERSVSPIGFAREGSLNALWTDGGLLYSPAWR